MDLQCINQLHDNYTRLHSYSVVQEAIAYFFWGCLFHETHQISNTDTLRPHQIQAEQAPRCLNPHMRISECNKREFQVQVTRSSVHDYVSRTWPEEPEEPATSPSQNEICSWQRGLALQCCYPWYKLLGWTLYIMQMVMWYIINKRSLPIKCMTIA